MRGRFDDLGRAGGGIVVGGREGDRDEGGVKLNVAETKLEDTLKKGFIPNLTGLSAKDALYLLENRGLNVKLQGYGLVKKQSISVGQKYTKGDKIILTLS